MTGAVVFALLPIVLLIGLGMILRQREFLGQTFWPQAERLGYYVLLPALFFDGLAMADLKALPIAGMAVTLIVSTVLIAALVVAIRPLMAINRPAFTSVFQGSIRFNNYVGITLASGIFGTTGVALAAICNAAMVPTVNILCVLIFARFGAAQLNGKAIVRQLVTNPLVVASFAGIAFQTLGMTIPDGVEPALKSLGAASLPLGLLCVGAALDFSSTRSWIVPVAFSSASKFVAMPIATLIVGHIFGLSGQAMTVALLFQSLPTASSAYIMAQQLGGDAPLMAVITAVQTVAALIALPLVMGALTLWP